MTTPAPTSLDVALEAIRAGTAYIDVDPVALEAIRAGKVRKPRKPVTRDQPQAFYGPSQATAETVRPLIDASKTQRIVYCVAMEPNTPDVHGSILAPESIEYTAHRFMMQSRIIKSSHMTEIQAYPVESFIAPQDLAYDGGMYGAQRVTKGSWVIGIKILDDAIWQGIVDGDYTGVSVGGLALQGEL